MDIINITIVSMILAIIGVVIYTIIQSKKYKHRVEIREIVNDRKIIKHDFAKDFCDDDKSYWWKLKKEKNKDFKKIPIPPSECIEIDTKGKKNVVMYRDEAGNVQFAKDSTNNYGDIKKFKPVTGDHRVVMINQIRKAEARRGKDWKQNIPVFVGGFMLLLIIVMGFVFIEDVAKPFIESKELQIEQQELMLEQTQLLKELKTNVQRINSNNEVSKNLDVVPD